MPACRLQERLLLTVIQRASAITADDLGGTKLVVVVSPRLPLHAAEVVILQQWVLGGGALLVLAEQGGNASSGEHR
jgi:hypothetical protein